MSQRGHFTDHTWEEFQRHLQARLRARAAEEGFLMGQWVVLERVISKAVADVYGTAHQEMRAFHGPDQGIGK